MNVINRILIVLLVLVSVVVCLALSFAPVSILRGAGEQMEALGDLLDAQEHWVLIAAGALFALVWLGISVLALILELYRPKAKTVRVEKVGGGEVEVSLKTISDRVTFDVDQLPGVLRVRPRVSVHRGGVVVEVTVDTAGEAEVPEQAAGIVEVVRQAVEKRVGVKLAQPPKVRLHAAPVPTPTTVEPPQSSYENYE